MFETPKQKCERNIKNTSLSVAKSGGVSTSDTGSLNTLIPIQKIYKTITLPVVLYGCETWSLTMSEERRLRVFENRVLRRLFGPKRDEVTRE
jgi:hypothetical protein